MLHRKNFRVNSRVFFNFLGKFSFFVSKFFIDTSKCIVNYLYKLIYNKVFFKKIIIINIFKLSLINIDQLHLQNYKLLYKNCNSVPAQGEKTATFLKKCKNSAKMAQKTAG